MGNEIQEQLIKAISNGQELQAIKILRTVENLSLIEAKQRVEAIAEQLSARSSYEQTNQVKVHSHPPARSGRVNIESSLPTEAFLFLQKGEVKEGLRVLKEVKGLGLQASTRLAKQFYTQHPEYTSKEITALMNSRESSLSTNSNQNTKSRNTTKKKNKLGIIEIVVIAVILFNVIKAFLS